MAAEQAIDYGEPQQYRTPLRLVVDHEPIEYKSELQQLVDNLDINWQQEGLPEDWFRLRGIGFNMASEMGILANPNLSREDKAKRVERNILGFKVEYLDQNSSVYPIEYETIHRKGGRYLYDARYRDEMINTVSGQERNGSVRDSLAAVQAYMLDEAIPVGATAVITSTLGPAGLPDNSKREIYYPDSYFFVFEKRDGGRVTGFGLRTDFSMEECREAVKRLTGIELSDEATPEDYARVVALIHPDQGISSAEEILDVLQASRADEKNDYVHKELTWEEAKLDASKGEEVYIRDLKGRKMATDIGLEVSAENLTPLQAQKLLAGGILRLSKHYLFDLSRRREGNIIWPIEFNQRVMFGQVYEEVEQIPGCAGGGEQGALVLSILERMGLSKNPSGVEVDDGHGSYDVWCKKCNTMNTRPFGKLLSLCENEACSDRKWIACAPQKKAA